MIFYYSALKVGGELEGNLWISTNVPVDNFLQRTDVCEQKFWKIFPKMVVRWSNYAMYGYSYNV